MRRRLIIQLAACGLLGTVLTGCGVSLDTRAARTVYLVPIGDVPQALMEAAAAEARTFQTAPVILKPIPINYAMVNVGRRQLVAEKVTTRIHSEARARHLKDERAIFGVTQADLFVAQKPRSPFSFNYGSPGQTVMLISTARLNPIAYGEPADEALLKTRLRKFVARDLTYLFLRGGGTNNPKCVTYGPMDGVANVDRLGTARC
jgi:predicted Zn-dependent protease